MISSAYKREDLLTTPASEDLARRLLAQEIGEHQRSDDLAAAGERAYVKLRERLAVLLGSTGFDALWARAIYMAQHEFSPADEPAGAEHATLTHAYGLHAALHGRSASAVQENLVIAFAHFITLLFTFIGQELGSRFIRQIWPDLSPNTTDAEDATS